jgi:hypothetical protein
VTDVPAPAAIAAVTTVGYLGLFAGPPLIGVLAGFSSLPAALWLLVAVSLLLTGLARPALARADRPPSAVDANGTGCPIGIADARCSVDHETDRSDSSVVDDAAQRRVRELELGRDLG